VPDTQFVWCAQLSTACSGVDSSAKVPDTQIVWCARAVGYTRCSAGL